jgi:hypothetical protein
MREIFHSVGWAVNKIASDYGIDFDNQIFEQGKATGEWFKVQLKSSENTQYSAKGDFISETLDKMHVVHFSTEMRDPVLLIHADVKAKRTFWFAPQLSPPVSVDDPRSTVSIRIPTENELPRSLSNMTSALREIRVKLGARTMAESPVTSAEGFVPQSRITELFEEKVLEGLPGRWHGRRRNSVLEIDLDFVRGIRYEIVPITQYGELGFLGHARVRVEDWTYPPPWIDLPPGEMTAAFDAEKPSDTQESDIYAWMSLSVGLMENPPVARVESFRMLDEQLWHSLRRLLCPAKTFRQSGTLQQEV